jgi:hypothetical protein
MRRILAFAFLLLSVHAVAQTVTVSSKVVDRETKEPLVFASVGIKDKPIGTITNLEGEFDFHFPAGYRNDVLVISILGYKTFERPAWTLLDNPMPIIEMEKSTFVLDEVVVEDSLKGGDILRIAISRIEQNYPQNPFLMDAFYRDIKQVGGTYISLLEAATKIYDEDYKTPRNKSKLRERVMLMEVRRSLGYRNKFTSYFDDDNMLQDLLLQNYVKYRGFPEEDIFFETLNRERDSYYNGHDIFVVSHTHDYLLRIFIDKTNFGIIRLEYETQGFGDDRDEIGKRRGLVGRFIHSKKVIDFRPYQDRLFLNYMTVDTKVNWFDLKSNELKFETQLNQQLLINSIDPEAIERVGVTEKMRNYGLQYQDLPYNKKFWEEYNVIKDSPLDEKIIKDLEKMGPLDKQFQNSN